MDSRPRELYFLMALGAVYVACFGYVIQSSAEHFSKNNLFASLTSIIIGTIVFVIFMVSDQKKKKDAMQPIAVSFSCPIPWKFLLANFSLLLLIACMPINTFGVFVIASMPFVVCLTLSVLHPKVHLGGKGVLHLGQISPWEFVSLTQQESEHLFMQLKKNSFEVAIPVPEECRDQAQAIYEENK